MNDPILLIAAFLAGCALGACFLGSLWWTVRRGLGSKQPALWFLGSLVLRGAVVLAGFYFTAGGRASRLVACLLGFAIVRSIGLRLARLPAQKPVPCPQEASRAS